MTTAQYSGQGRERLITATAATSDANGLITFRVGPCPLGFVWQGSVTITNAPSGALLNASVASTPWGQWAGPTNFGPVQLWGNETLVVTGVGLLPSTQYSMLFFGVAMPDSMAEPLPPVAPLSTVSVETTTLLVTGVTITGGAGTGPTFQPPSLTRRLTIIVDATSQVGFTELDLIGVQTGTIYTAINPVAGATHNPPFFCAIEPAVDQTYKLSSSVGGGSVKVWVLASSTNPEVATNPASPLSVVGTTIPGTPPISVSSSPVGSFKQSFTNLFTNGANQALIAAPGAGLAIYLQEWNMSSSAGAIGNTAEIHPAGAGIFSSIVGASASHSQTVPFPGGYELAANTALQADVIGTPGLIRISGTYTIGPVT